MMSEEENDAEWCVMMVMMMDYDEGPWEDDDNWHTPVMLDKRLDPMAGVIDGDVLGEMQHLRDHGRLSMRQNWRSKHPGGLR